MLVWVSRGYVVVLGQEEGLDDVLVEHLVVEGRAVQLHVALGGFAFAVEVAGVLASRHHQRQVRQVDDEVASVVFDLGFFLDLLVDDFCDVGLHLVFVRIHGVVLAGDVEADFAEDVVVFVVVVDRHVDFYLVAVVDDCVADLLERNRHDLGVVVVAHQVRSAHVEAGEQVDAFESRVGHSVSICD